MATLSKEEWYNYRTIYSLLGELERAHSTLAQRHQEITAAASSSSVVAAPGIAQSIRQLISLTEQIEAEMRQVDDTSVDVSKWLMYMADMDGYVRRLWIMPSFFGTANNFSQIGSPPSDEVVLNAEDTWNSIEAATGISWQSVARQNRVAASVEGGSGWAGRTLMVPKTSRFGGPVVQGIVGAQSGAAVLGRDFANSLKTQNRLSVSDFSTKLNSNISDSHTGKVYLLGVGTSYTGLNPAGGYLKIETELMYYSSLATDTSGDYAEVTRRGVEGTVAAAHMLGETVRYYPQVFELDVLDYTDTFIQGCSNALEAADVQHVFGADYGSVKGGILLVTMLSALKRDPRVENISNVVVRRAADGMAISMDISSVGQLTTHTLNQHYSGNR